MKDEIRPQAGKVKSVSREEETVMILNASAGRVSLPVQKVSECHDLNTLFLKKPPDKEDRNSNQRYSGKACL